VLAGHAFDRLDWQEFLWHVGGLQVMVKQARIGHLNQYYGPKICRIVGKPLLDKNIVFLAFFAWPF
jgi:hypothetical protein